MLLRIMALNIAGGLHAKVHDAYIRSLINDHDICAFSHTGSENIGLIKTHKCISMPRPTMHTHGGVACLVKNWLAPYTVVARQHPHLGILWLKIKAPSVKSAIFLAICYLPPSESTYYKETPHTITVHFDTLRKDILHFSSAG